MKFWLLTGGLLVVSLHDFYFFAVGWPVVSVVGALLTLVGLSGFASRGRMLPVVGACTGLGLLFCVSGLLSSSDFGATSVKGVAGPLFGCTLLGMVATRRHEARDEMARAASYVLAIHVGFWIAQFALYQMADYYLDVTGLVGDNPARHETYLYTSAFSGFVNRCTGLFAEPSAYSVFVFMLMAVRLSGSNFRLRMLDRVAVSTMLATFSLTGMALGVAAILLAVSNKRWMATLGSATISLAVVVWFAGDNWAYAFERTQRLDKDGSVGARFGSLREYLERADDLHIMFGRGIGSYADIYGTGSGVSWLLVYLGVLGSVVFLALLGGLSWRLRLPLRAGVAWLATLLVAPFMTVPFWWIWTGALLVSNRPPVGSSR